MSENYRLGWLIQKKNRLWKCHLEARHCKELEKERSLKFVNLSESIKIKVPRVFSSSAAVKPSASPFACFPEAVLSGASALGKRQKILSKHWDRHRELHPSEAEESLPIIWIERLALRQSERTWKTWLISVWFSKNLQWLNSRWTGVQARCSRIQLLLAKITTMRFGLLDNSSIGQTVSTLSRGPST